MSSNRQPLVRILSLVVTSLLLLVTGSSAASSATTTLAATNGGVSPLATVVTNCTEAGLDTALAAGGAITFNCAGDSQTITVTSQKTISKNTSIDGTNHRGQITIHGSDEVRVFYVSSGFTLTLNNLKIAHGNASRASPNVGNGGGIDNAGTLVMTYVFFDTNQAGSGGGLCNEYGATATLNQVYFQFNAASYGGGGLFNNGTLASVNSGGFSNNTTDNYGAGIFYNGGTTTFNGVSFDSNNAGADGGGLYINNGVVTVTNTSFTSNQARDQGGAIYNSNSSTTFILRLDKDTFTSNHVTGSNAGAGGDGKGGAVYMEGGNAISISSSNFTTNSAKGGDGSANYGGDGRGGAIFDHASGPITITATLFDQNKAIGGIGSGNGGGRAYGGAIDVDYTAAMTVISSTFSANTALGGIGNGNGSGDANGGAIVEEGGTYSILGSTFNNNIAQGGDSGGHGAGRAYGGAIFTNNNSFPVPALANSTMYANSAVGGNGGSTSGGTATGGAMYNYAGGAAVKVINSTITANSAAGGSGTPAGTGTGGGVFSESGSGVTIANTIVTGNTAGTGTNCNGTVNDGGYNIEFGSSSCGLSAANNDQLGDPKLGSLANNGGPTKTVALQAGSAAIDNGSDTICAAVPIKNHDQRGFVRPFGAHCDIGAYEFIYPTVATTFTPATIGSGGTSLLKWMLANPTGIALTNVGFTGTLPNNVSLQTTPTGTCGGTINVSGNTISVSSVSMTVGATCTISGTVTATTPGTYFETTSAVSSTQFGTVGSSSTATLIVKGPADITATAGSGQSTTVNTTFPTAFKAKVTDSSGDPIIGATVTFFAPGGGASCVFAGGTASYQATTDANGVATALDCTANGTPGAYKVQATTPGVTTPATFNLTNTLPATTTPTRTTVPTNTSTTAPSSTPTKTTVAVPSVTPTTVRSARIVYFPLVSVGR